MEKDTIVTLPLKREELLLLHTALCEQRAKLGNTISELASFDLEGGTYMKITYLTEEHMDFLASEVYGCMDEDEKETWDIEAAQAVAHDLRLADGLEIDPELIYDFISELIGLDADE